MKQTSDLLYKIVEDYTPRLYAIGESDYAARPNPNKWSKKEIIGHLIDSAQCNIRRFVVAQYEDAPHIVYDQDKWVALAHYQDHRMPDLIALWKLLNIQLCMIVAHTDQESALRICKTDDQTGHTIEWLSEDYTKHLLHHLHQVCNLEPVAYP